MNCARARFLIYAYLDRQPTSPESEFLSRHLAQCAPCSARAASARGLAHLLHSRLDRKPAPPGLRARLHEAPPAPPKARPPVFAAAAALLVMLLPLDSDVTSRPAAIAVAGLASAGAWTRPVSRRMTGTFVCLECEARSEAGLCPVSHEAHATSTGFCAANGELWRLMSRERAFDSTQASLGRTATVEGVAFPESGFLRVSRVGY
ncbi:MAG TPA: zf-HC2 domain-containing protein [Thermoanaerobaculia bacterium]|nr:zf-HC2 domain-containing protein [Thermoanaerobaculia bacterium]